MRYIIVERYKKLSIYNYRKSIQEKIIQLSLLLANYNS